MGAGPSSDENKTTQNQHQQQNKSQVQIHPANLAIQLGNITDPSLQKALVNAVCDNEQALTIFTKLTLRLNKIIVKEQREFDTRLPLELQNFTILSKVDTLTTILSNNNFTSTQELVQQIPTDQDVLEKLRRLSTVVSNAYKVAIQARLATKNIGTTCRTVVLVGNRDLSQNHNKVWELIYNNDNEGSRKYKEALTTHQTTTTIQTKMNQTTMDPIELYQHAAIVLPEFQKLLRTLAQKEVYIFPENDGVNFSMPSKLKDMGRVIEKSILQRQNDPGNANQIYDVVHGTVVCENMTQIATVFTVLVNPCNNFVVTHVKDSFYKTDSKDGFRDCTIYLYLKSDVNKHICEIQLVHLSMTKARKGLSGSDVYNYVKSASELEKWVVEQPKNKEELQHWLIQYHKKGDKVTHGHPNLWDTSQIKDLSELFKTEELEDFNEMIGDWDLSQVTNMNRMFMGAETFNQNINAWDVSNCKNMERLFRNAKKFNQPLNTWDVSNCTNMKDMFQNAEAFDVDLLGEEFKLKAGLK